jgi:hypothetical protein
MYRRHKRIVTATSSNIGCLIITARSATAAERSLIRFVGVTTVVSVASSFAAAVATKRCQASSWVIEVNYITLYSCYFNFVKYKFNDAVLNTS